MFAHCHFLKLGSYTPKYRETGILSFLMAALRRDDSQVSEKDILGWFMGKSLGEDFKNNMSIYCCPSMQEKRTYRLIHLHF